VSVESADAALEPEPAPLAVPGCVVGRKPGGASLGEVIAARRCLAPREKWIDPYDASAFSFSADPPSLRVQRRAHAELFVQIDVKAAKDELLQLRLGCLELVETAVHDAQGKRIDELGDPPDVLCMAEVVQVVVRAGDGASLRVPFAARRHAWKQLGVERRDAGPLPAGSFELRLRLPFWTAEDEPVELSVPIEITR
jgi:hypothetical protein